MGLFWWLTPDHEQEKDAEQALTNSKASLAQSQERWAEVYSLSEELKAQRRTNSLAQAVSDALHSKKR